MRRSNQPPDSPEIRVFKTPNEIDATIIKLKRRIADIEMLRDENVRYDDARVTNVQHQIRDSIREEFGKDSVEGQRHEFFKIEEGPRYVSGVWEDEFEQDADAQRQFREAIPNAITRLEGLIHRLDERRADLDTPLVAPRSLFLGRTFHPEIKAAAESLWQSNHYAQAVFEAGKALIALVKAKSGSTLDGAPLMQNVFSVNNPILKFNTLADQSDKDEQQGMMQLYTGAVLAIRNPGGHRVGATQRPERELQHLELLSYLSDRLDETKR